MGWLVLALLALLAGPAQADMYQDASNATLKARTNLGIGAPYGTLWSSLGIVADGVTDNTAALNALPVGTAEAPAKITADCPAGSFVRFNDMWLLKSYMHIKWQPGCRMVSYLQGTGTYAMGQANNDEPLTNITLDGLHITKDAQRPEVERILFAWINHLKLVNWTVPPPNSGWMFIRGSCQEIAYNSFVAGRIDSGAPGIRHIGNEPKVAAEACKHQIADVWVHDNNVISGDSAYQSCQPLHNVLWINVSSDDMLWEKNTGSGGTYLLVGAGAGDDSLSGNYTCTNITYRNIVGYGYERGILMSSVAPTNALRNITFNNIQLDARYSDLSTAYIHIRGNNQLEGDEPGVYSDITLDGVSVYNTPVQAIGVEVPSTGSLDWLTIRNGVFDSPRLADPDSPTVNISGGNNITLQNNIIRSKRVTGTGGNVAVSIGFDNIYDDARTVTNFTFIDNVVEAIPDSHIGVWIKNAVNPIIKNNIIKRSPTPPGGGGTGVAIRVSDAYTLAGCPGCSPPIPAGTPAPGTTGALIINNILNDKPNALTWTCNGGGTNFAYNNLGDPGEVVPVIRLALLLCLAVTTPALAQNLTKQAILAGTGSFTVPNNVWQVWVNMCGGGASGGASGAAVSSASGGTSGEWVTFIQSVSPGQVISYTVGAGGAAPTVAGDSGNAGANSTFVIVAFGGVGGIGSAAGNAAAHTQNELQAKRHSFAAAGTRSYLSSGIVGSGPGTASAGGVGGSPGNGVGKGGAGGVDPTPPTIGQGFCSGGGGGHSAATTAMMGAAGAAGTIIVTY